VIGPIVFLVGGYLDFSTTRIGLKRGLREGNPVLRFLLNKLPWDSEVELAGIKLAFFIVLLVLDAPLSVWLVLGILQALAAAWNYRLIRKSGRR